MSVSEALLPTCPSCVTAADSSPVDAYVADFGDVAISMTTDPWDVWTPQGSLELRVSVVIPTLNEARNLPQVFAGLPPNLHQVVLVDGRSSDSTPVVARRLQPRVEVVPQPGKGKGDALAAGFRACRGDVIVMIDADGSMSPREIPEFVAALVRGADYAKGSRFMRGGGTSDITVIRRLGNWGLRLIANGLHGTRYTDLCYGYNAFWADCLEQVLPDCAGFEVETLMNLRASTSGLRVVEVPSFEAERLHGESKLRAIPDGMRVLRTLLGELGRRQERDGAAVGGARERPATRPHTPYPATGPDATPVIGLVGAGRP